MGTPTSTASSLPVVADSPDVTASEKALPPELMQKAAELAQQIVLDPTKPETITSLGAGPQRASAAISDQLLSHVQVKDAGQAGNLLMQLSVKCRSVDTNQLAPNWRSKASHMPVFGKLFTAAQASFEGYQHTLAELENITRQLTAARATILKDVDFLGTLYQQNLQIYKDLQLWVQVGRLKRDELDTKTIPQARTDASASADPLHAQKLADLLGMRERLDKHIHDLELTAMIRLQNAPKIRIVQAGDIKLADKLQSSVLNTIPLWKDNLALSITQNRQKEAAELEDQIDDTTNALLRSSADMLHENAVMIARQANRDIADIETLKHTQQQLLATIDDTQRIAEEGFKRRESTRAEMVRMQEELKQKLSRN